MRRFSNDLWTGIVCGYFFVFAYEGAIGLVRLIGILVASDPNRVFSPGSAWPALGELVINLLDGFAGVQLMRRVSYANVFAKAVIFVHLLISTDVIYREWQLLKVVGSYLPVLYNLSQMVLALMVFCILGYLRVMKNNPATTAN